MKIIHIVLLFFFISAVSAQDILQGVVAEKNERGELAPLIGANLFWLGTPVGATTDSTGFFKMECKHETHSLVVSYIGYEPDTLKLEGHEFLTIILKNVKKLKEVEVTYRKKTTSVTYMDVIKTQEISEQELFKAACCNLSESFETTPSVDVAFTDALTGTRQIQMLGLSSAYTLVTQENVPYVRGLAAGQGFSFIPGTWIHSIQLSKGTGSVVNGFESIAGQINVELKRPESCEEQLVNVYLNEEGRLETNLNLYNMVNLKWRTATLLHAHGKPFKMDRNNDGFLDFPRSWMTTALHRWRFDNYKGMESEFGVKGLIDEQIGGQTGFNRGQIADAELPYGVNIKTHRMEAFGKVGYVFPEKVYKSMGLQLNGSWHDIQSLFGLRNYDATHYNFYSNYIFQSIIVDSNHKFKTGASYLFDHMDERMDSLAFNRSESVAGAFFEYTYSLRDRASLVAGGRVDYNNLYGVFVTPRLHTRFEITEQTILRLSAGRGQRTANIIAENMGLLATSRAVRIVYESDVESGFRLRPEVAWNYGASLTQDFKLAHREGQVSVDYYRTDFIDQVVVDVDNNPQEILFYNLTGKSFSNSLQAQVDYEALKKFDIRLSYRWYDVQTTFTRGLMQKPLVAQHRAFINLAYETGKTWKFDYTVVWTGQKRIPFTASNPEPYRLETSSPNFLLMNAQITKIFKNKLELYVGVENLANFRQKNPILAAEAPYSDFFDSSLIWGPIFGRTTYAGFRYKFNWRG